MFDQGGNHLRDCRLQEPNMGLQDTEASEEEE